MSRLIVSLGLLVLFALGYTGVEKVALSGVKERLDRATQRGAQLVAAQAEVEWLRLLQQTRGVVIAGAEQVGERWPDSGAPDVESFRSELTALLDRAGGRGSVALFAADRRKLLSVAAAGGAELDPTLRAIEDARGSGALAHLEFLGSKPTLIAAAPLGPAKGNYRPVVAVSVPIDRRTLTQWATIGGVEEPIALLSGAGDVVLTNIEVGIGGKLAKNASKVEVGDDKYAVVQRPLIDDGAIVGTVAGMALEDNDYIAGVTKRLRLVYGLLAVVALILVLVVGSISAGPRTLESPSGQTQNQLQQHQPMAPPSSWLPPPAESTSPPHMGDNLLAAARVLEAGSSMPPSNAMSGPMSGGMSRSMDVAAPFGAPLPPPLSPPPTYGLTPSAVDPNPAPRSWAPPAPPMASSSQPPVTFGRGMSPAPPAQPGPQAGGGYQPTGTFAGYTPLPMLEADPDYIQAQRLSQLPQASLAPPEAPRGPVRTNDLGPRPFDEGHYRVAFEEFVTSKMRLGDPVESISYEGFRDKLLKIEQTLIEKHGCRSVRFQVIVRDRQVSLRPQLVR